VLPDGRRRSVKGGRAVAEVCGDAGEVLLFVTGRSDVARVDLRGDAAAIARVRASALRL
jgi:hypothetical protein